MGKLNKRPLDRELLKKYSGKKIRIYRGPPEDKWTEFEISYSY